MFENNSKPRWKDASVDQKLEYNDVLFRRRRNVTVPCGAIGCRDLKCNDVEYTDDIEKYVKEILEAVNESGIDTIPAPPERQSIQKNRK